MPPLSEDGRWWWDGQRWQSLFSADGSRRWDGRQWQPVAPEEIRPGTAPPATPPGAAAPPVAPAPPVVPVVQAASQPLPAPAAQPYPYPPAQPPAPEPWPPATQQAPPPSPPPPNGVPPAAAIPVASTATPSVELVPVQPVPPISPDRPSWLPAGVDLPGQHYRAASASPTAVAVPQPVPWQPGPAPHYQAIPGPRRNYGPLMFAGALLAIVLIAFIALGGYRYIPIFGAKGAELHQEAVLLLAFQKDDVFTYKYKETIDGITQLSGSPNQTYKGDVTGTLTLKILSVDAKGVATAELTRQIESGSINGQNVPRQEPKAEQVQIASDGRLSGGELGSGADPDGEVPGADQFMAILPDGKVRPGDSWTKDFDRPNPVGTGSIRYHTSTTLARYETLKGTEAAVVQTDATAPMDFVFDLSKTTNGQPSPFPPGSTLLYRGKVLGTSTSWIDARNHNLLKTDEKGDFDFSYTFYGVRGVPSIPVYYTGRYRILVESK